MIGSNVVDAHSALLIPSGSPLKNLLCPLHAATPNTFHMINQNTESCMRVFKHQCSVAILLWSVKSCDNSSYYPLLLFYHSLRSTDTI